MPVPPVVASIVYWRNYTEDDNTYVEDKTTPSILSIETVGFEAPTGYEFQEWNTARDGSGYSMSAGDAPAASKVYAIWKEVAQDPYYLTKESELTSVANAIRTKGGTSAPLAFPAGFVSAINAISGGGGITVTDLYKDSTTIKAPQNYSDLFISASATGLNIAMLELESTTYNATAYLFQPFNDAEAVSTDMLYFVGSNSNGDVFTATFIEQNNGFTLDSVHYEAGAEDVTGDWGKIISCRIYHA